jgi:hypothetical protein
MDEGKARADGLDQYGIICVFQKPSDHRVQRFGSVVHDWDSTTRDAKQRLAHKEAVDNQFSAIEEEDDNMDDGHRDIPFSSVERTAISGTPLLHCEESEELGGDPLDGQKPHSEMPSRKRKQSFGQDIPVKEARLETSLPTQPVPKIPTAATPSPARRRGIPTFASPQHRRPSAEKPAGSLKRGLGVAGFKSSSALLNFESSQVSSNGPPFPSSAPSPSQNYVQPALHQNASLCKDKRLSVSFAETSASTTQKNTTSSPRNSAQNASRSFDTPSSSQTVCTAAYWADWMRKMQEDAEEAQIIRDVLQGLAAESQVRGILLKLLDNYATLEDARLTGRVADSNNCRKRIRRLRDKLKPLEPPIELLRQTRSSPTPASGSSFLVSGTASRKRALGAETGPNTNKSPPKRTTQDGIVGSSSSSDYADALQNALDQQGTVGTEQEKSDNVPNQVGDRPSVQAPAQAEVQLIGSGEESESESRSESGSESESESESGLKSGSESGESKSEIERNEGEEESKQSKQSEAIEGTSAMKRIPSTTSSPARQPSSQPPHKRHPSLKELLKLQKEEIAAEIARTRPTTAAAPPSPPRPFIFDLGDYTDSSSDSDDEKGEDNN